MTSHYSWSEAALAHSYAWVPTVNRWVEPVRATPLPHPPATCWDAVTGAHSQDQPVAYVVLHHPDLGEIPSRVTQADLRGRWDEPPPLAFTEATGFDPGQTWSQIAEARHTWVMRQRQLAERLTELGIPRARRHYAGHGGSAMDSGRQVDANLVLTHQELLHLVSLAERGNT